MLFRTATALQTMKLSPQNRSANHTHLETSKAYGSNNRLERRALPGYPVVEERLRASDKNLVGWKSA